MNPAFLILAAVAIPTLGHFGSIAILLARARRAVSPPAVRPPVSVLRPVCGLDNHAEETLASAFAIAYPQYELIFCVAEESDPVIPLIERLIADHPGTPARLLVGDDRVSVNPKLNNLVKGLRAARHDWIVMTDSNVLTPPDYLDQLMARWLPNTGLVCSPPVGTAPEGFGADLECTFLNTYAVRWQLAAEVFGIAFAQGKTMLWQRSDLERAGGAYALASEPAEDSAATKMFRQNGRRIRLVPRPNAQPLGRRTIADVWRRQLRWARLRRVSFPLTYAVEAFAGGFFPLVTTALLAAAGILPVWAVFAFAVAWYGAELALARVYGWPVSPRIAALTVLRDLTLPVLWLAGWTGRTLEWRGRAFDATAPHRQRARRAFAAGWRPERATSTLRALAAVDWRQEPEPIRTFARLLTNKRNARNATR